MKNTQVTVVIPFFNGSRYIERALQSVYSQTVPAAEVIVVDDGSTPAEAQALHGVAQKYPVRVIRTANGGQGSARNLGIKESNSELICLLDQDDFYLDWHIEHLLEVWQQAADERFAFAYGDLWRGDESGTVLYHSWLDKFSAHPKTDLEMQLREDCYIIPSATLIVKTPFLAVGGFDERLIGYEDEDLFTRFFAAGYTSVFTPRPVTFWTINESSASFSIHLARSRWIYFEKLLETYPDSLASGRFILRDCLVPRFTYPFIDDYIKSCFAEDAFFNENKERLQGFLNILTSHPSCSGFGRQKRIIGWLLRSKPRTVVSLGTFAASRLGNLVFGPLGRRTMRPRLRELVLMRKIRNGNDVRGNS